MLRRTCILYDRDSSRKKIWAKYKGRLMNQGWIYLNNTPKGRLGGKDRHTQVYIQYTSRKPMLSTSEMKAYSGTTVAHSGDIVEPKKVTENFQEKHLPDFKRPAQPTIWEKEDWWQWRLPAEKLPQGQRGTKWDGWEGQIQDYRKRYRFLMNPGATQTKSRMKAGLHYSLDQRYDTSDKIPEPSFDITGELQKLKLGDEIKETSSSLAEKVAQATKDIKSGKTEAKDTLDKYVAEQYRHQFKTKRGFRAMHNDRAKLVNWNAAIGRKETEIDRWRKEKNVDPVTYKKIKDKLIGRMKAQALWAEKQVATETAARRDGYKIGKQNKNKSKLSKPKQGEKNAKMKSLATH